jgi:hypothetical protein
MVVVFLQDYLVRARVAEVFKSVKRFDGINGVDFDISELI